MENKSVVNSQPTSTVEQRAVPAGTEGIILSNFDIANEDGNTRREQNKDLNNTEVRTIPCDEKQLKKWRRRRRSYDYDLDITRDDVKDCACDVAFHAYWCLCCKSDDEGGKRNSGCKCCDCDECDCTII